MIPMQRALYLGADATEDLRTRWGPLQWGDIARGGKRERAKDADQLERVKAIVLSDICKEDRPRHTAAKRNQCRSGPCE